jgi:hypothetical protein
MSSVRVVGTYLRTEIVRSMKPAVTAPERGEKSGSAHGKGDRGVRWAGIKNHSRGAIGKGL